MPQITYEQLFEFLIQLEFVDTSCSRTERTFEHSESGVLLAFLMPNDLTVACTVRGADILSVEFRLQQAELLTGSLQSELSRLDAL